ncbi:hypothetical protein D3C74_441730 [compost metagenome]
MRVQHMNVFENNHQRQQCRLHRNHHAHQEDGHDDVAVFPAETRDGISHHGSKHNHADHCNTGNKHTVGQVFQIAAGSISFTVVMPLKGFGEGEKAAVHYFFVGLQ